MGGTTGPTLARLQLGKELQALREAAGLNHPEVAELLGCSVSKIYKLESGDVGLGKPDLTVMLDRYGIRDAASLKRLFELQRLGKQRGWWSRFSLPGPYASYIGLESDATAIHNFQLAVVPGLFQTDEYSRALIASHRPTEPVPEVDRLVEVRTLRQRELLSRDPPATLLAILDEAVLRRQVGGPEVMRRQLQRLVDLGRLPNVTVQVVPFTHGGYVGTLGSISMLEFPEDLHSPVAYAETLAGDVYLESEVDVKRATDLMNQVRQAALNERRSAQLITAVVKDL